MEVSQCIYRSMKNGWIMTTVHKYRHALLLLVRYYKIKMSSGKQLFIGKAKIKSIKRLKKQLILYPKECINIRPKKASNNKVL